jgi:hypothetical protein
LIALNWSQKKKASGDIITDKHLKFIPVVKGNSKESHTQWCQSRDLGRGETLIALLHGS